MPQPFKRADRVGEQIQRALSELLRREVKDPRVGGVVVTVVRVSADLRHAHVRFTCGSDQARQAEALAGLLSAAGYLRGRLGRSLHLRYAPDLSFALDDSVDYSLRIAALLKQVGQPEAEGD
ncbi:MAG: 30S ribosome-binding factor RbfA [candidate division NC10 bacterium]|nr:30S ribosome-binding factor RbfA [candidate division NC10 bacterium]